MSRTNAKGTESIGPDEDENGRSLRAPASVHRPRLSLSAPKPPINVVSRESRGTRCHKEGGVEKKGLHTKDQERPPKPMNRRQRLKLTANHFRNPERRPEPINRRQRLVLTMKLRSEEMAKKDGVVQSSAAPPRQISAARISKPSSIGARRRGIDRRAGHPVL